MQKQRWGGAWGLRVGASALLLALAGAGCTPSGQPAAGTPLTTGGAASTVAAASTAAVAAVSDMATLVDALHARGLMTLPGSEVYQDFLSVEGFVHQVGPEEIQIYEYPDEAAAKADAANIGPDGTIPGMMISWRAQPHFYQVGRLLVIYPGTDARVLEALKGVLGQPFAVGEPLAPGP